MIMARIGLDRKLAERNQVPDGIVIDGKVFPLMMGGKSQIPIGRVDEDGRVYEIVYGSGREIQIGRVRDGNFYRDRY
mgnify:CR=1 FL=1